MVCTWPLVVTATSVKQELSGKQMAPYLLKLADPAASTPEEKADSINAKIEQAIQFAQARWEEKTRTFLTRRVIKGIPVDSGLTLGTDYDWEDDNYDYVVSDWETQYVSLTLRRRPLVSVERVIIRYGQTSDAVTILEMPEQWNIKDRRLGILHIVPVPGSRPYIVPSMAFLAVAGGNIRHRNHIPKIVTVDYTAGYLPADFDPETDDVARACPFEDVRVAVDAVLHQATANMLRSLQRTISISGGSISIDGLSRSVQPAMMDQYIRDYETLFNEAAQSFNRLSPQFRTV